MKLICDTGHPVSDIVGFRRQSKIKGTKMSHAPNRHRIATCIVLILLTLGATVVQAAIPTGERTVLLDFYTSTGGATWTSSANWNGPAGTECTWHGVTCDVAGTTVTGINLPGNNLTGSLPGNLNGLTNLATFYAYNNHLAGPIPSLTGLTSLAAFWVYSNQLTGSIPALTGLTNLTTFIVVANQLTGSIPALTGLTNLATFQVYNNQLTGQIPALAGLTSLVSFWVSSNQLTGPIPTLTGLTNLAYFVTTNNQLTGSIPVLTGLTKLNTFVVSNNQLTGSIPALTGLTNLSDFEVSLNQLTGSIPALTGLANLNLIVVSGNQLTGSIPALAGLTNLAFFEVNDNQLTGSIPALSGLSNLFYFWVQRNQLTGTIPALTGLTSLIDFEVNNNQLTGTIPALTGLTNLGAFIVNNNQLTGNVPSVPSPNALAAGGSSLCPNFLIHTQDPAWDAATGDTPWFVSCTGAPPPTLLGTVSRHVHGAAGTFDLPLSLVPTNPTTEPRQGPAQTIVLTFDKPIVGASVAISEGTATAAAPAFSGNDVVVDLTGISNQQYVTIGLTTVASADGGVGGSGSVRVGFLAGDVNQNRVVTVADLGLVNAQLSQVVTAANFLKDVNASGTLTLADKGITNANLTKALAAP
jgi:hypothetical protein